MDHGVVEGKKRRITKGHVLIQNEAGDNGPFVLIFHLPYWILVLIPISAECSHQWDGKWKENEFPLFDGRKKRPREMEHLLDYLGQSKHLSFVSKCLYFFFFFMQYYVDLFKVDFSQIKSTQILLILMVSNKLNIQSHNE